MIISCGRRTAKFRQIHKIPRNSQKHARYRNIFGTYLSYWCCSIAANLRIYLETSKQHPKTTRRKLCCKKLGTSHDIKSFAIGSFLDGIVVERANDYLFLKKCKNSGQIIPKPINPSNRPYVFDSCSVKFTLKIPMKIPQNQLIFRKI